MGPQEAVQLGAGSVVIVTRHITPFGFFGLQFICFAIALGVTRLLFKLNWVKSLWISAGIATVPGILVVIRVWTPAAFILGFLPLIIVAVIMFSRSFFRGMDDSGKVNSAERQRTLEMVEQGKISSEEGAELLDALGRSNAMLGQDKFSRLDMLILAGVAIAVLGFFLPWVHLARGMYQSGQHFKAEGWAILIITILAAIPVFVTPKNFLYKISMLQIFLLLLDSALVISLLFRVGGRMGAGLPVCLIGFVLALLACFRKFKKLAA